MTTHITSDVLRWSFSLSVLFAEAISHVPLDAAVSSSLEYRMVRYRWTDVGDEFIGEKIK